jgi:serine/threonine protein phosphatase PrpC
MGENRSVSLRIGAGAHRGLVREENQDRISRIQSPFGELFIVADGMGGHEGGGTAAQMLIDGLDAHLRALPPETPPEEALRQAAQKANADIYRRAQDDRRLAKMGATGVLALVQALPKGHCAWIAHAGDSRAYLWRGGGLERLTRDHTLVQRMVDHQILNEDEARHHPDSNVVTRGFGQSPEIEMEVAPPLKLREGDRLLLCSDGLSGYVDDAAIAHALAAGGEAQAIADALIDLALRAGGEDNVSLQLLAVQAALQDNAGPAATPRPAAPVAHETAASTPPAGKPVEKEPRRGAPTFFLLLPLILAALLAGLLLPWRDWLAPAPPEPAAPEETAPQTPSPEAPDATDPFAAAGTEAPPESTPPQPPRVTVMIPPGLAQPEVKQRVLREYPGNWSSPRALEDRLASSLAQGRVYYRAGFGAASAHLAQELGYAAVPWPEDLAREHAEADLLVVYGGTP